ncbi:MAG: hypothetical protein LBP35_04015 [Candidatus Ancillula trichonymphae]|nr:hypothetical protein [Candidatus Ancillula trichonymphae]
MKPFLQGLFTKYFLEQVRPLHTQFCCTPSRTRSARVMMKFPLDSHQPLRGV